MRASDRPSSSPLRQLGLLATLASAGALTLLVFAGVLEAGSGHGTPTFVSPLARTAVRADTDTVVVGRDTIVVDTSAADSTQRARYLLPSLPRDNYYAVPVERLVPSLLGGSIRARQQEVVLDSSTLQYRVRETVGSNDIRVPVDISLQDYLLAQRTVSLEDGFRSLASARIERQQRRAGVGINLDIPGGNQSAFRTIFGKNEVDLRVTGNSLLDLGLGYDQNALQQATSGRDGSFAPDFGQELNLNVAGTIGDKLRIDVNYDTQSQFDFENQVSLVYTGYEDDILQKLEAGNVFLQTPSELIRGGQRLFGLRTDLQFGPLAVTAVASQQDAESEDVVIDGGSQESPFDLAPTRYEDNTHFFLGFSFYNWWDSAHSDATIPTTPPGLSQITGMKVWVQDAQANNPATGGDIPIYATALVDLAEPVAVLEGGRAYLDAVGPQAPLPNGAIDQYDAVELTQLRSEPNLVNYTSFGLTEGEYKTGRWRQLRANVDYTFDDRLGWLSLTGSLGPNDALAVTYQYRAVDGTTVTVGDFADQSTSGSSSGDRSILKLLRDNAPVATDAPWDLTMRNIYRIGGRSLNPENLSLQITYTPPGNTPQRTLPGIQISDSFTLLQALGLDRTTEGGTLRADNRLDFINGYTVDQQNGRIIFPVREPFGRYLEGLLRDGRYLDGTDVGVTIPGGYASIAADVVFPQLYELKRDVAERELNKLDRYSIEGTFRGASQSVFNVGFGLVEGSVTVTSGGTTLVEGTDYLVNETAGTVEIRNPIYLAPNQQIRVSVEKNKLFSIGSKTLVGLRSDYRISEKASLGATWMRLAERPLTDKFRIGEEALENTVFGFDGGFTYEPRWLTRAIDALPLIQTRAVSSFEVRGEYAQFSPGHPETFAFSQVQRDLASIDRSLTSDELNGISSVDDFEAAENVNTALLQAPGWRIAAPPRGAGPMDGQGTIPYTPDLSTSDPRLATSWRGLYGWYSISGQAYQTLEDIVGALPRAARQIFPQELYVGREFSPSEQIQPINLLDLYFDPRRRGPYNFNNELATTFANDPSSVWGGMTRSLDAAYADFDGANTVESIDFLFAPLGGVNGDDQINPGAVLNLDLGILNEDTLPNGSLNSEDGVTDTAPSDGDLDAWGRIVDGQSNLNVDLFDATGHTEDLGLDGLPSSRDLIEAGGIPYALAEPDLEGAQAFLGALPDGPELLRAQLDPAGDDYHHFRDTYFNENGLFPGGATVQERYAHYYSGVELNTTTARNAILPGSENGISTVPSTEDINNNFSSTKVSEERFYRYQLPLDDAGIRASPYFTGSTIEAGGATFYLIRIPVRSDTRINEGGDLSNVEMVRLWTTGHTQPATLRFATFELVGSQWQKSEDVGIVDVGATGGDPTLFVASINTDENPRQYLTPVSALRPVSRDFSGTTRDAREQSLVLRIEDLGDGQVRGLYKPFSTNRLDLTKYSNVRMYVHGEGFEAEDDMRVFMRLGSDETENYYEIEQPLYPAESEGIIDVFGNGEAFLEPTQASDYLWQTNACPGGDDPDGDGPQTLASCSPEERRDLNSINVVLSELNRLKVTRDASGAPVNDRYTEDQTPEGAPPEARLSIIGTPSVQSISTIVVGVRNAESGQAIPLEQVEVWFNELRVTGYDEGGGSSAFVTAQGRLADVASANARVSYSQDGFGGLGGGLGERDFVDRFGITLQSTLNAHKLLPERYGWNMPIQISITENQSTPRYDPTNSDIRVDDLVARTLEDSALPEPQRRIVADSILAAAQTVSSQRTLRIPLTKTGSRSPWLKYTLDAFSLSYTNSTQEASNPRQSLSNSDSWRVDANYRLTVPKPRTVRPFWFTNGVPLLGSALSGVRMNLLPRSLSFGSNTGRTISVSRERPRSLDQGEPEIINEFLYPRRTTHDFGHNRSFNLQYELFPFLTSSYGSNSVQSLDLAGVDERFRLLVRDTLGVFGAPGRIEEFAISRQDALAPGSVVWDRFGIERSSQLDSLQILGGTTPQLNVVPWTEAIGATLGGYRELLTDRYDQSFNSTLRVSTRNVKWLAWIQPQPIGLTTSYAWNYRPITGFDQTVSDVNNNLQLQTGLRVKPRDFWRLFPFYRTLEKDDQQARQASDQRRRDREAERQRRKAARQTEREQQREATSQPDQGDEEDDYDGGLIEGVTPEAPVSVAGKPGSTPASGANTVAGSLGEEVATEEDGGTPLIDFGGLGRRLFLAVTGIEDVQLSYRGGFRSTSNGVVGDGFSLLAALTQNAPPLSYRLGLDRQLPLRSRLSDPNATLQLQDILGDDHQVEGRTTLQPTKDLRITLSATTSWNQNDTFPIDRTATDLTVRDPLRRGSGQSTIYAIGGSYDKLLALHLQRLQDDVAGNTNPSGQYASLAGSASGIAEDFVSTYAQGAGSFGPDGLFAIPLPSWEINWTGLSRWPILNRLTQQVTVQHNYYATNQTEYRSIEGNEERTRTIGAFPLIAPERAVEPEALVLNERFQPLLGVRVGWKGGLSTEMTLNRSRVLTLQPRSAALTQQVVGDIQGSVSYSKTGFRLPLFKRLRNTIRFTLTTSVSDDQTNVRYIVSDIEDVLGGTAIEDLEQQAGRRFQRVSIWPRVGYQISNRVNMDVFFRYEQSLNQGSVGSPRIANYDGGVTLRISFSN